MAALLLPLLGAKTNEIAKPVEFDLSQVEFVEVDEAINLGFDSSNYLPEDFDPYTTSINMKSIDFIEEDKVDIKFDTEDYLPEGFNAYQ